MFIVYNLIVENLMNIVQALFYSVLEIQQIKNIEGGSDFYGILKNIFFLFIRFYSIYNYYSKIKIYKMKFALALTLITATYTAPPDGYHLIWSDEFEEME